MVAVMCAAHVGRASDPARSHATQRRLRDTMLVGARATSLFSDADHSAAAAYLERLLRAGYRCSKLDGLEDFWYTYSCAAVEKISTDTARS